MNRHAITVLLIGALFVLVSGCEAPSEPEAASPVQVAPVEAPPPAPAEAEPVAAEATTEQEKPPPAAPEAATVAAEGPPAPAVEQAPPPVPVIASDNLLGNGSFEADASTVLPYWRVPEGVTANLDDAVVYDGANSLRVEVAGNVNLAIAQYVAEIVPGTNYLLRGYVKAENVAGDARLEAVDAEQGFKAFCRFTSPVTGTQDWTRVQVEFSPRAGSTSLRISLRRPAGADAADTPGVMWFDRCELFQLVPAMGPNLVVNPGFDKGEDGLDGWIGIPEGVTATKSDAGQDGPCVQIALNGDVNLGVRQPVKVTPGTRYSLAGYVKCEDLVGEARLEVVDAERGWQHFRAASQGITGTQDWTQLSLVFTVPEDVETLGIRLRRQAGDDAPATPGTVWFDTYMLFPLGKPSDASGNAAVE